MFVANGIPSRISVAKGIHLRMCVANGIPSRMSVANGIPSIMSECFKMVKQTSHIAFFFNMSEYTLI